MANGRPMLGDVELQLVQKIETDEDEVLTQHGVPALEGDFLQRQRRRATQITLSGVLTGPEAGEGLKTLRDKFRAAEPVPFVVDIATATRIDDMLIEEMGVRELAGRPERFEYAFTLREYIPAEEVITEEPPPDPAPPESPAEDIDENVGTLIVEVIVEGQPDFDFSQVTVTVQGTTQDGETLSRTLTNREGNIWTEENVPASQDEYTVQAIETNPQSLSGSATATVGAGQRTQTRIPLHPTSNIAKTFIVHFRFDKAFVEPCMRRVLKQVAQYAQDHSDEKLLIVGHTDKAGPPGYNQSLSERRARSVFAFLTLGVDDNTQRDALTDWDALRQTRQGGSPTVQDNWDVFEYQHILQGLAPPFYVGRVDGQRGPLTRDAVQAYRCHQGLPPGTDVDDDVWRALIKDYLTEEPLAVPATRFFPNCEGEILKWLGCGEDDPLDRRGTAFRPSRRVELLFVRVNSLPCEVPQPATFNLAPGATVNANWCLDSGAATSRCCLVSPWLQPNGQPQPCPTDPNGPWCRQPAEPDQITVVVSIQRELADGTLESVPDQRFVLISPKGEFKAGEQSNGEPSPERTTGSSDSNPGTFTFPNMPVGFYTLEVRTPVTSPVLVRLLDETDAAVKGNAVCKHLHPNPNNPTHPVRLDVVIVNAPVMREIRLPVVAHLMTPLDGTSTTIRTCPNPGNPGSTLSQATARTDDEVRELFEAANTIWRQARIRFEPVNIVRSAYIHPITDPVVRGSCEVDNQEFKFLLSQCVYPDVINIFFFGDLSGTGTGGMGVSPENAATDSLPGGGAIADRFQATFGGGPVVNTLTRQQSTRVLAHVLGQFLNLEQVTDSPANADRLMRSTTVAGTNIALIDDEVARTRSSQASTDDCVPLSLEVTDATQIGGILSNEYIFVQHPVIVDPFDITVDAKIPDHLLVNGTLTMTDGTNTIIGNQITVSKANVAKTTVTATYTPTSGGQPVSRHVVIRIATFELDVTGATRISPDGNTFVTSRHPTQVMIVIADIDPGPFCLPKNLVAWSGGNETPDPWRHTVARAETGSITVGATVAGESRSVTITVIEVRIPEVTAVGQNQTVDIPITIDPTPLPSGVSIKLQLRRTSGTGEARFVSTNSTVMTVTQTTTVSIRGITASSVEDNIQLNATIADQPEIITQEDFSIIAGTMILHPALGFPGLAEPGGEVKVVFLVKDDLWSQSVADGRRSLQLGWRIAAWSQPQQSEPIEFLDGPNKIEAGRIRKSAEGWVLVDHQLQLNSYVMTLYGQSGFRHLMYATIKVPSSPNMYQLINRFAERTVLYEAIRSIHTLNAFEDDFPDNMPLIPDRGITTVTAREGRNSNIPVEYHHPIFVTDKTYLNIAQVSDTHVALRWELYDRRARPSDKLNNYNRRFEEIMSHSRNKADIILLTGDIVDYNRGHFHPWDNVNDLDDDYQFNRNWLLAYELILNSYAQNNAKPIFTMTGNHDWNLNAYAPIPHFLGMELYKSSHDFNLLERDIERIDPGDVFESDVAGPDKFTQTTPASILWYSLVINPVLDFAFSYKEMAFLCLDWGNGAGLFPPFEDAAYSIDQGILPYPTKSISDNQWSIIQEWHRTYQDKKIKTLALHATIYQPYPEIGFEDLSQGRIHDQLILDDPPPQHHPTRVFYSRYTHGELIWGSIINAHHRRDLINLFRNNLVNLVLYGHCHRNTIFQIREQNQQERVFMYRPNNMTNLDLTKTLFVSTTSAGPLGYRNDTGVAEYLDGLEKRTKIHSGYRIITFSNSGNIISLDTFSADGPNPIRREVQEEFRDG